MSTLAVHRVIEEQASTHGDRPAVADAEATLSYRGLNQEANALARHLIAQGFRRGALLAVPLRRTPDTVILLLAVLKTGGSYSLLDQDSAASAWSPLIAGSWTAREPMPLPDLTRVPNDRALSFANLPILARASDVACILQSRNGASPVAVPHGDITARRHEPVSPCAPWIGDPIGLDLWLALMSGATVTLDDRLLQSAA